MGRPLSPVHVLGLLLVLLLQAYTLVGRERRLSSAGTDARSGACPSRRGEQVGGDQLLQMYADSLQLGCDSNDTCRHMLWHKLHDPATRLAR